MTPAGVDVAPLWRWGRRVTLDGMDPCRQQVQQRGDWPSLKLPSRLHEMRTT
jgi:hypothetical protein